MDNMTALVSTFARAYHYKNNHIHIFADPLAEKMLTDEEYAAISENMAQGISYFAPILYVVMTHSPFAQRTIDYRYLNWTVPK